MWDQTDGAVNRQVGKDSEYGATRRRRWSATCGVGVGPPQVGPALSNERRSPGHGVGLYPSVGLSDARIAAADARKLIARGVDPLNARKSSRKAERPVPTFGDIAKIVIADAQSKSTNAKVRYQWERHLGTAYSGALLARPVHEITTIDVAAVLAPIWRTKPELPANSIPDSARLRARADSPPRRARDRHARQPCAVGRSQGHGV